MKTSKKITKEVVERAKKAAIRTSTRAWIHAEKIVNEKGKRIKIGKNSPHYFLNALYDEPPTVRGHEVVVQKPSQIGVSTWAILSELHDSRFFGINQIHTLPTAADVTKFVPSKVNEIIKRNPSIKAGMDKKEVESVNQKQFGKGFIYFKGTKSESESLMLTSDRNTYDELDKSDAQAIGIFDSRQEGHDSWRQKRYVSTPTVPNFGVNKKFLESDQKHWRFVCPACKLEQHMVWPDNVDLERKRYVCSGCQEPITEEIIRNGRWKARYPKRKISGYHITQMIVPWIKAESLVDYYSDALQGKNEATMEYFFNHKLGLPYVSSASRVGRELILANLTIRDHLEINSCMGVDVQERELYIMIGNEEGVYVVGRIRDDEEFTQTEGREGKGKWDRWAEMMEAYDVRYCVIDGGYKPQESIKAAERFPGKVWVNWYKDDPAKVKAIRWNDDNFSSQQKDFAEEITVLTGRNAIMDLTLEDLRAGRIRFFFTQHDDSIKMLISHIETTYARTVTNRIGLEVREWVSTGKDDLLHAMLYFKIARERQKRNEG